MRNLVRNLSLCFVLFLGLSKPVWAQDAPRVVTDILPVHSLVAQVMRGVGEPDLLLGGGGDPHNHSLRPSQAAALENADLVIAIGPQLTPWLERPLARLASEATLVTFLDVEGTNLLEYRDTHDHGHDHGHSSDTDPHAWLDPANGRIWLSAIAEVLAKLDPSRGDLYRKNAETGRAALSDLNGLMQSALLDMAPYGVHHDAFQYFESHFGIAPAFVVKEDDAHQPGPARIAKLRAQMAEAAVSCVFVEPLVNRGLVETVIEGSQARILELAPLGINFEPGPDLYAKVLREMIAVMAQC